MSQPVATPGAPCWVDLFTSDPAGAEAFYGQLFGWTAEHSGPEYGGYVNFAKGGHAVAGAMANEPASGMPDVWTVYLATGDIEATARAVDAHGGSVVVPPMQVMDMGSMAVFADVASVGIAAWQPGSHTGFGLLAVAGAPAWFELHTRDYAASVRFYQDVFGWDAHVASDAEDFRYTTLGQGDAQQAGIMDVSALPAEQFPSRWSVYFAADDADATAAQAVALGGSVVAAPQDSPFGRLATLADPTGATFKIQAVGTTSG